MADIHYKQFPAYLKNPDMDEKNRGFSPVFLIYGEEYLCKTVFEALLDALIPDASRDLGYESVDGTNEAIVDAVQRVNTYALIPGKKVVAILDSQIFHSRQDTQKILETAKKCHDDDNMKKAGRYVLNLLALMNVSLDDIDKDGDWLKGVKLTGQSAWLEDVIRYCREQHLSVPRHADRSGIFEEALEKGFPRNNHLIITTDLVDKRRRLYKLLLEKGIVVDCSVPKGARKADKDAQETVLKERMASVLETAGKTVDRQAYSAMVNMIGFDLRTFVNNVEKLVSYVGDRKTITRADVEKVVKRTKKDPIFEFTNAITDRRLDTALFYMNSLLSDSDMGHPLQLLAAIINQVRKLVVIKGFIQGDNGNAWYAACPYNAFQSKVMPAVQAHDSELLAHAAKWEQTLESVGEIEKVKKGKGGKKKKKPKAGTDLVIAKNPRNAYPIYQMFKKTEHFTMEELLSIVKALSHTDQRLKTSGQEPKSVLEKLVFSICRHEGQDA